MKHTISVMVDNKPGVLARVAGLFSARGYNIDSLAVSQTLDPTVSYMTIVVNAEDERILEQIKKQLNKLIDIITITDYTKKGHIEKELVLVKINYTAKEKERLEQICKHNPARMLEHCGKSAVVEVVGGQEQIKKALEELAEFGITELTRTGKIAIAAPE